MSNLQPNCCLKFDFQKVDQHVMEVHIFKLGNIRHDDGIKWKHFLRYWG